MLAFLKASKLLDRVVMVFVVVPIFGFVRGHILHDWRHVIVFVRVLIIAAFFRSLYFCVDALKVIGTGVFHCQ